jgi:hypothetical protein
MLLGIKRTGMLLAVNGWLGRTGRSKDLKGEQALADPATTADVTVADLRAAITKLLDAVEAQFGPDLQFPEDFYWNVPFGEATEINDNPKPDMGSVMDDTQSVREFLSEDGSEFVSIWHEADHLAGVLRAIARLDLPSSTS